MNTELENPGSALAAELRTLLLVAVKLGELMARRVEMKQRHARSQAFETRREVERRTRVELGVAEGQLRAVRNTMRTLAGVNPSQIATSYQTAVAWRGRSAVAEEVATSIETYMRNLGIDPAQLGTAGRNFARTMEPTSRPGVDFGVSDADRQRASITDERWRDGIGTELDRLTRTATFSTVAADPQRREQIRAELDRIDTAAAREDYARTQGLAADAEITPDMLGRWREQQAVRWATKHQAADLALFTALVNAEDSDARQFDPAGHMVDLWLAWRARESEGLPHPDLAQVSGSAFYAQLDRAHTYFSDNDPDFYDDWNRMRATDPTRADRNLVHRYEVEHAQQWAAEIGDDLWKHGFARTAAEHPDADLDEIARRVWVAAGKPQPEFDPDVAVVPLQQRWTEQVQSATKVREQIEAAPKGEHQEWQDWLAWRGNPDLPPDQRVRGDADLVAEFHTMQAEQWEAAAVEEGTIAEATAPRDPGQLMAAWRRHTGGQALARDDTEVDLFARAERWLQTRDPVAYLGMQAQMSAVSPDRREQIRAELVRDYETHEARRWAEAAETIGIVEEGTAALDPDELIERWREFTDAQKARQQQQPPQGQRRGRSATRGEATVTEDEVSQAREWFLANDLPTLQRWEREAKAASTAEQARAVREQWVSRWRDATAPRRSTMPTLADLARDRIPDWVIGRPGWKRSAEKAFRGLVAAGADPQGLADSLSDLRYEDADSPIALTIWRMQKAAGPKVTAASKQSGGPEGERAGRGARPRRAGWNSAERQDSLDARLAGVDPDAARVRKVADRAFGSAPRGAVDDSTGTEPPRSMPFDTPGRQRSQGQQR